MIYSKPYRLNTSDTEWEIAHLFEHLLIRGFYSMLEGKHIQSHFISWLNGQAFEGVLFIDTLFYTEELARSFEVYITHLPAFSKDEILYAIATLQAENKVLFSVKDMSALQKEIEKLRKRQWDTSITALAQESVLQSAILTEKHSAKNFRDIVIITKAENLTPDEQKLFLRARILLMDIVAESLVPIKGLYQGGHSDTMRQVGHLAFMSGFTTEKGITIRHIRDTITGAITSEIFDLEKILKNHFDAFSDEPLWQGMPIDYFRTTGVITTNKEIASFATVDRMRSIISKIHFDVRRMSTDDRMYLK